MITAIHHIAIIISSENSIEFYKLLGFSETFGKIREYDTVVLMEGHGINLEMFIDPRHPASPEFEPIGVRHFALKVDNIEEELQRLEHAASSVIRSSSIMEDWIGKRFCYIYDPDGLAIELNER